VPARLEGVAGRSRAEIPTQVGDRQPVTRIIKLYFIFNIIK